MYLAIMLIVVAILVFYNELNNKMSIAEYMLLAFSLIAIIRAAVNYIQIDVVKEGFNSNGSSNRKNHRSNKKNKSNDTHTDEGYENFDDTNTNTDTDTNNTLILNSEESLEYLDSDEDTNDKHNTHNTHNKNKNSFDTVSLLDVQDINKKSDIAVKTIDSLLGVESKSEFNDIPKATPTHTLNNEINSSFNPKVIISKKKGGSGSGGSGGSGSGGSGSGSGSGFGRNYYSGDSWNSAFNNDGFKFNDSMSPDVNLWRDEHGYYNGGYSGDDDCNGSGARSYMHHGVNSDDWTQSMDDYNKGKWKRNLYTKPSDYVDYYMPQSYGTNTPDSIRVPNRTASSAAASAARILSASELSSLSEPFDSLSESFDTTTSSTPKKKCAQYDDLNETQGGDIVITDYKDAKKWVAGYTYVPPIHWDVPQKHTPVCKSATPDYKKLTGLMDRGLPINALELTQLGVIADTEDKVTLSNVGSMIPKFNYQEQPFSKPYV